MRTLPLPTRILLGLSGAVRHYGWLGLAAAVATALLLRRPGTQLKIKNKFDKWLIALPFIKNWIFKREMASYARTLGSLLKSGVPALQALTVALGTVRNSAFRDSLAPIEPQVREGRPFSKCLRAVPIVPAAICNLAAVGEEGGRLDETLLKIADSCERQSQRDLKTAVSLLEPFLILVIGALLGAVVISILLPIFEINALIR